MKYSENTRRFFYNGAMLTAVGIGIRTVALFFNAFVTRRVGAEGIGLYTIVMTVYNFAITFATSGISLTVTRLVASAGAEGEEKVSGVLFGSIIYALVFSSLASLVLGFGAGMFSARILNDLRTASSLRILAPSLIPIALVSVFSGYFVGIRKVSRNALTQILGQVFKIGSTVFLLLTFSGGADVERSAMALALGTTLTEIICFIFILIEFLLERRSAAAKRGSPEMRAVAGMALPLAFSAYIRSILITIEHILIPKRLYLYGENKSEALSSYGTLHGMALPMVLYPMATLSSFAGLLVPEFAERSANSDKAGMRNVASRAFSATLMYACVSAVFLFAFSEELGYVVYDSYSAGIYIAVLAPVVPIMYLDHVTDSVLKGIGEHVYSMWVNISDSVLSIILVFLIIPKMGIMGYALCIVIMEGYNFLMSAVRLLSRIRFRISVMRAVVLPLISAFLSAYAALALFVPMGRASSGWLLGGKMLFALCIFIGIYKLLLLVWDSILSKKYTVNN